MGFVLFLTLLGVLFAYPIKVSDTISEIKLKIKELFYRY